MRKLITAVIALILIGQVGSAQFAQPPMATTGRTNVAASMPQGARTGATPPKSYAGYYNQGLQPFNRPQPNAARFTFNRVFAKNPAVSPYVNLGRSQSSVGLPNYFQYVRPELNRRAGAAAPTVGPPAMASNPRFGPPASSGYGGMYGR